MLAPLAQFQHYWGLFWPLIALTWWAWLPFVLAFGLHYLWLDYLKMRYYARLKWIQLEVHIPREVAKPPQAMEQIFAAMHSALKFPDFYDTYVDGVQTDHFSFEIASVGGVVHFFVTIPEQYKNFIEAQIYAQYPESEIVEVKDYMQAFPVDLPDETYNLFGSEFGLAKPDGYPIRSYKEFVLEGIGIKEEDRKVDPISAVVEVLGKIKPTELIGIQLLIKPVDDSWKNEGEKLIDSLLGKAPPPAPSPLSSVASFIGDIVGTIVSPGAEAAPPSKPEKEKTPSSIDRKAAEAIQENITKIGFETILRFLYVAKRPDFSMMNFAAMNGALRQFNTQHLNSFRPNGQATTSAKWYNPVKARTKFKRQVEFYKAFRSRKPLDKRLLKSKPFTFNIEELATIYHYPGVTVAAPRMHRIEAKTSAPPINLPME